MQLRVIGLVLLIVFGLGALVTIARGVTIDGIAPPSVQCQRSFPEPDIGGPFLENSTIDGSRTFFPLGIICSYDSPDDSLGAQTVWHQNWPATIIGVGLILVGACGGFLLFRPSV